MPVHRQHHSTSHESSKFNVQTRGGFGATLNGMCFALNRGFGLQVPGTPCPRFSTLNVQLLLNSHRPFGKAATQAGENIHGHQAQLTAVRKQRLLHPE